MSFAGCVTSTNNDSEDEAFRKIMAQKHARREAQHRWDAQMDESILKEYEKRIAARNNAQKVNKQSAGNESKNWQEEKTKLLQIGFTNVEADICINWQKLSVSLLNIDYGKTSPKIVRDKILQYQGTSLRLLKGIDDNLLKKGLKEIIDNDLEFAQAAWEASTASTKEDHEYFSLKSVKGAFSTIEKWQRLKSEISQERKVNINP